MLRKLQSVLVVILLVLGTTASGQKMLHKANKQYDLKHYNLAIETYQEFLVQQPGHVEARAHLADSYRMSNQLVEAGALYQQLVSIEDIDPSVIKQYGLTLMKMGNYDRAKYYFEIYKVYDGQEGQHYSLACDFAKQVYMKPLTHEIELVNVNTPNSDFGVTFLEDQLVFSSFRGDLVQTKKNNQALNGNILYIADLDEDMRADNVRFLRSGISEKVNIGPVSYNEAGGMVAFARNKIKDGGAHVTGDDSKHSLYIATMTAGGNWENESTFRYNEFGTSTAFPSLAFNGNALYFASNRVGGYGGYDIYVSYYKDGEWSYPSNLGPNVNTKGNEITPHFDDETLYFASDYLHGMGGYDIFESTVSNGQWTFPTNMGNGVNSCGDDYYPAIKRGSDLIVFSSNRLGGRGMDDIYLAAPVKERPLAYDATVPPPAVKLSDLAVRESASSENIQAVALVEATKTIETPTSAVAVGDVDKSSVTVSPIETVSPAMRVAVSRTVQPVIASVPVLETDQLEDENTQPTNLVSTIEVESDGSIVESITYSSAAEAAAIQSAQVPDAPRSVSNDGTEMTTAHGATTVATESSVADVVAVPEQMPEAYKLPDFKSVSPAAAPLNADLSTAKRVALGEILPAAEVYFIQLAALYRTGGNVNRYNGLKTYGNLYKVYKSNSTKIKLGYFLDKEEAKVILSKVKSRGYSDAFITRDQLNSSELELIVASEAQSSYDSYTTEPNYDTGSTATSSKTYKIRLASYEDPIWFDIEKARGLGQIEQWTKGGWTIFILGGYGDYQSAEAARIRCVNQGFADAEVVIDNNGILERLRMN